MKRSEMISIIHRVICGCEYNCDPETAKMVLDEIEERGMLPPHAEIAERKLAKKYAGPGYYSDGNNWEPEDET